MSFNGVVEALSADVLRIMITILQYPPYHYPQTPGGKRKKQMSQEAQLLSGRSHSIHLIHPVK